MPDVPRITITSSSVKRRKGFLQRWKGPRAPKITVTPPDEAQNLDLGPINVGFLGTIPYSLAVGGNVVFVLGGTTVLSHTPAQTTVSGELVNGAALNPKYGTNVQQEDVVIPSNWDGRSVYSSEDGSQPTYPLTLQTNDILVIAKSNLSIDPDTGSLRRNGVVDDYAIVVAVDALPSGETLAPYVVGQSDGLRTDFTRRSVNVDAFIATLPGYTVSGNLPDINEVKLFVNQLNLGPVISYLDSYSATHERGAYEMWSPSNSGVYNGSNYGEGQSARMDAALMYICLNKFQISDADRKILVSRLLQLGCLWYEQCKGTLKSFNEGGAHYQWIMAPIVMYLLATGQYAELDNAINTVKGSFSMPFIVSASEAAYANAPHSDTDKFCYNRRRAVTGINGNDVSVFADVVGSGFDQGGDPSQFYPKGLRLIRESDGAEALITEVDDGGGLSDDETTFTIDAQPSPAFTVSDVVYMLPSWTVNEGHADWSVRSSENRAHYVPSAEASYRNLNRYSAQAMAIKIFLNAYGRPDGEFAALFQYAQLANNSTNSPVGDDYPSLHTQFTAVAGGNIPFVQTCWDELNTQIFGAPDVIAPVISNAAVTGVGEFNGSWSADINEDTGILYILVNRTSVLPGLPDQQRATIEAGGGDYSHSYLVQPGATTGAFTISGLPLNNTTYYAHVFQRDAAGNPSAVSTVSFLTQAAAPASYAVEFVGYYEDDQDGPYTWPDIPIGSFNADRRMLVIFGARSGTSAAARVAFDGVVSTGAAEPGRVTHGENTNLLIAAIGTPLGTTMTVTTPNSGGGRGAIAVYKITKAVVNDFATNLNTSDQNYTTAVSQDDSDVIVGHISTGIDGTESFTGFTMDVQDEVESGFGMLTGRRASDTNPSLLIERSSFDSNMHTFTLSVSEAP